MTGERAHDLVVFGATGYTGRLVAAVLARRAADEPIRWAIAGRTRAKLERIREELGRPDLPILVGDALDPDDMRRLAASTRVVCSTAGPYARYGSHLVAACAESGTHYCDLSGEVPWMRTMIERHDAAARSTGARIVPACGFDSLPSDLGAFLLQERARERFGRPAKQIHGGVVRFSGGMSGGTARSALDLFEPGPGGGTPIGVGRDPNALIPSATSRDEAPPERLHPHWDTLARTWTAPWPMALVNARVVRRSAALRPDLYGPDLRYEESMWLGRGATGAVKAAGVSLGIVVAAGGLSVPWVRAVAERVLPEPGEGPSSRARDLGHWEMRFVAAAPGPDEDALRVALAADEDPGYGSTSKMLVECALALTQAPSVPGGGFLTPATAFGRDLVERLRTHAGVRFDGI